eukprot:m.154291 g.154291  ORF g.154291 m.154291 type:complete len:58 (+) comp13314_c0_seq1:831-1004(+)
MFIETSAKAGHHVKELFRRVAAALPGMEAAPKEDEKELIDVKLTETKETKEEQACSC